ncbi:hypothetical protein [Amorphus sp. 3PC139-8]|uniref:hypothetical protein n=1 Tax=Amorphus sp. 3PC139-8 TaxID=2735676 RepID=UPI00345D4D08
MRAKSKVTSGAISALNAVLGGAVGALVLVSAAAAQEGAPAGEPSAKDVAYLDFVVGRMARATTFGAHPVYLLVPEDSPASVIGVAETTSIEAALTRPGDRVRVVIEGVGPGGSLDGLPMAASFDNLSVPVETTFTPPDLPDEAVKGQPGGSGVVVLEPTGQNKASGGASRAPEQSPRPLDMGPPRSTDRDGNWPPRAPTPLPSEQ